MSNEPNLDEIELDPPKKAGSTKVHKRKGDLASKEFVDERMVALYNVMKVSMEPAIAVLSLQPRKQNEILTAFNEFEELINEPDES